VLQLKVLSNLIKINGIFYDSNGNGVALIPNYTIGGAGIMILGEKTKEPIIKRIFKYPIDQYAGEIDE
jgi:hypothetical protein